MSYSLLQKEAAASDFEGDFDTKTGTKESREDHKFDYLWDDELVGNNGVIRLSSEMERNSQHERGAIGMFHQIHCLTSLRKTLQRAREGQNIGLNHHDDAHWPHCLYYMRQAILCAADDTIELPHLRNKTHHYGSINGVSDIRQCRNAERLYDLRAKHGVWGH
ncbi:hypothetical protein OIDMADRAFT_33003 [Oidiodendron maius Zn]|uniref:Uncharacterized protein n=1 Tax=Oidiodendron maius (strain Zn) TaxID=913774 RepID=A0A0C3H1F5_OIDMZ|nr:hypothetical protein OIDMADRAFT_33003 [Oidiodendron maius Zn]